ncbi:MAG: hypothetical protein IJ057_05225 [Bacteroidales bacterium]|nr:hypothetical protein [Bacteroidales bacterium]
MKKLLLTLVACLGILLATAQTIAPSLTEEMAKRGDDEKIMISIVMQEQTDATVLLRTTNAFATNKERREYVVATLKRQAEASQAELLDLLHEFERNGLVDDIRPLWIANAIGCNATKNAITALAQRGDIRLVYKSETLYCPSLPPVAAKPNSIISRGLADHIIKTNADKV